MRPVDVYEYYAERAARHLRSRGVERQVEQIKKMEARIVIFDFCGKIPTVYRLFTGVEKDVFVVYDALECKETIKNAVAEYDLIYVLEEVQSAEKNILYGNRKAVFLLFDKFRLVKCA